MKTIFKHKTLTALFSILVTLCMLIGFIGIGTTTAFAADTRPPHNHCSCGLDTDVCDTVYEDHHKDYLFPIWESDTRMPFGEELDPESSGSNPSPKVYYYLVHDVAMSDTWEIQNEGKSCNITICLYDHTITNENSNEETPVIELWEYGRLYLTTCGRRSMDGDAEITHTEGTFGSGVYVGRKTDNPKNDGYFYMYGGNIVRNASTTNGGGVWVKPKGKFEMYRGSISSNTAYGNGGGVYNTGVFNMYGGTISDNNAQGQGDGVYNINIFNMTGGTISSTGVAIENTGTMTISGGTVSGSQGIRNVDNGTVKLSGNPTISSTLGTADICCLSTNEGQIDADGYTGKTLRLSIDGTTDEQENFDLLMNKIIVKNATVDKFLLVDENGQPYMNYALVQEGNDLVLREHIHNYTYSVNNNILTQSCSCGHEKNATISAPTGELVYNGSSFNASVVYDEGWVGEQPTISYTKNSVATSDTTGAGDYVAGITIEGATASVNYRIEKATPTDISWPTGLKGIAGNHLNTITLPNGFTWITPNRVMDYNMRDADIRYQPNANYNPVENSVSIEVDDDKNPTGTISIGDKTWSSFVEKENISFNTFFKEKQTVTITVDDGKYGSGVDYDEFGYYISTKKKSINELSNMAYDTWKEYSGAFEIKSGGEYIIYVRFQDYANNMTYLSSDGIVLDSTAPTISGITNGETYYGAVEATVSDTYFDRVEIGGVEAAVIDGKFTVNATSGAQEIIAYDKAGNTIAYTITVNKIKVTKPAADNTAFTYNGEEQTYTIAESGLYTVTNNKREDAGMQKVTIALKDKINYEWTDGTTNDLEYDFNIEKATPTADIFDFTAPTNLNACDGLAKEATVTVKEGVEGVGSVTIKYFKGETELTGAPTTVGTYTVKIEVAEGENYNSATLTAETWTFTFDITDEATHTGLTLKSNENGTHDKFCTVCEKVFADDATCVYEETVNDAYVASKATCISGTTYYKSCECGHKSTETFVSGSPDSTNHDWNDTDVCSRCNAVKISEKTFPDEKFRNFILGDFLSPLNEDEILTSEELQEVKRIAVFDVDYIRDLTGIEYFTELTTLEFHGFHCLKPVDLSKNTKLTEVYFGLQLWHIIIAPDATFDLNTLGIDVSKLTLPEGCTVNNGIIKFEAGVYDLSGLTYPSGYGDTLFEVRLAIENPHTHVSVETFDDCTKQEVCLCGDITKAAKEHDFSGDYLRDEYGHWHKCKDCEATDTKEDHYAISDGNCETSDFCVSCNWTVTYRIVHKFDNACDTDCNNEGCEYTRTTSHVAEADDGDCSTAILCEHCDEEMTAAKTHSFDNNCDTDCNNVGCNHTRTISHTPGADDGNCETPIHCSVCDIITTSSKSHSFTNACDTNCNNAGCEHTRTITHSPEADDGDCTTDIHCSICDAVTKEGNASHTGGTATCTAQAVCEVCDTPYGNTLAHTPEADDGNCMTEIKCSVCQTVTTPANAAHTGGTATCQAQANCSVCGTAYGEALGHDFRGIGMDENEHWSNCSRCDATGEKQAHTIDGGLCTVCEYQPPKDGLSGGAIAAIVVASVTVLGGGGFALWWFVFKKKRLI